MTPDWEALQEQWPENRRPPRDVPGRVRRTEWDDAPGLLHAEHAVDLAVVYKTRNVKPDEVNNRAWNDLLGDKWKGRVAWDAQALGFKELPFRRRGRSTD